MRYEPLEPITKRQAERMFAVGDTKSIIHALLRSALHVDDLDWVMKKVSKYSTNADYWIRSACTISLGHLARLHRRIDNELTAQLLIVLYRDPKLRGIVEDAISDIRIFADPEFSIESR